MEQKPLLVVLVFSLLFSPCISAERKSYIVYLGKHSHEINDADTYKELVTDSHHEFLGSFLGSKEKAKDSIFYSYTNHINGFAANLNEDEVSQISKHPDVVSVLVNKGYDLHTSHSWEFMGQESAGKVLPNSLWEKANLGEDMIVATIDTGVWPESDSFSDEGYGPIPARWKGICQNQTDDKGVVCNRKLIGARYFEKGFIQAIGYYDTNSFRTPRDTEGHGTHTLSTAGGSMVHNASVHGFAQGTIKGGAPRARVAAYKVCWTPIPLMGSCFGADIIAGIDAAIGDGVDVLSLSFGSNMPSDYFQDPIAIATFHAISNGISVVMSAGNSGPTVSSVSNLAPWQLTVAASTQDREFPALVFLGNNKTIKGQSLSLTSLPNAMYPLVMAIDAKAPNATPDDAVVCESESLDWYKAKGKIVICVRNEDQAYEGFIVKESGGVGMILINDNATGSSIIPDIHPLPATHLTAVDAAEVLAYMRSTKSPVAYIGKATTSLQSKPAPSMAFFSSKGPNSITPEILKPDVTAPGVKILAAYSLIGEPLLTDAKASKFNILSGTSMSCPHVSGIVTLLKKLHPDWSPAAIKSAIMTTAFQSDNMNQKIKNASLVEDATPFDYGAGHVLPNQAADPGLVYDIGINDYLNFFCALGYNTSVISRISRQSYQCPSQVPKVSDLNYPSISVVNFNRSVTVSRTLKNVGTPGKYMVDVQSPVGVSVSVMPMSLNFEKVGEEQGFNVTFTVEGGSNSEYKFGWLTWSDGKHQVRSPLVVKPL